MIRIRMQQDKKNYQLVLKISFISFQKVSSVFFILSNVFYCATYFGADTVIMRVKFNPVTVQFESVILY